jgi:hypothetical protein
MYNNNTNWAHRSQSLRLCPGRCRTQRVNKWKSQQDKAGRRIRAFLVRLLNYLSSEMLLCKTLIVTWCWSYPHSLQCDNSIFNKHLPSNGICDSHWSRLWPSNDYFPPDFQGLLPERLELWGSEGVPALHVCIACVWIFQHIYTDTNTHHVRHAYIHKYIYMHVWILLSFFDWSAFRIHACYVLHAHTQRQYIFGEKSVLEQITVCVVLRHHQPWSDKSMSRFFLYLSIYVCWKQALTYTFQST